MPLSIRCPTHTEKQIRTVTLPHWSAHLQHSGRTHLALRADPLHKQLNQLAEPLSAWYVSYLLLLSSFKN
jgi:hypothetical protein